MDGLIVLHDAELSVDGGWFARSVYLTKFLRTPKCSGPRNVRNAEMFEGPKCSKPRNARYTIKLTLTGPLSPIGKEHLIYMIFFLLRFIKWLLRAYKYRQLRP